jgi:hypothetical protein
MDSTSLDLDADLVWWHANVVANGYSSRELSVVQDVLIAIAGVADYLSSRWNLPYFCGF